EHREAVAKATLYYIYNCNAEEHAYKILKTDLANEADNFYKLKNNAESNIKWNTFYFYSYFNEYLKA
ncbi:35354_t:CDS:2, partial [Gigaspora margarita]